LIDLCTSLTGGEGEKRKRWRTDLEKEQIIYNIMVECIFTSSNML
jgi:hypothetical protein